MSRFKKLLSWGCQSPPLHRHLWFASTPSVSCIPKNTQSTFGTRLLHLTLVPPLPFLPASTVYSAHQTTGLLHPAADHGVRHVSGPLIRSPLSPTLHIRRPVFSTKTQPRSLERARRQTPAAPPRLSTNRPGADPLSTVQPESCPAFMSPGDLSIPKDVPADPCDHTGDFHSLWRLYPSKLSPRHQPYPVTAVSRVHRRPLPPRRSHSRFLIPLTPSEKGMIMDIHRLRVDLEVLLQCRVRCTKPALPPTPYPLLPWAYQSSSVPFSRTPSPEPKLEL